MARLGITIGGGWTLSDQRRADVETFVAVLDPSVDIATIVPPRPMKPGHRGLAWGEIVIVYIGMKALDLVTEKALDEAARRILESAKKWARGRVQGRLGNARVMSTFVQVRDEDGRSLGFVSANPTDDKSDVVISEAKPDDSVTPPPFDWAELDEGRSGTGSSSGSGAD